MRGVEEFTKSGLTDIAALIDGKDFLIETERSHGLLSRAGYSDKSHHNAFRCITWILPCGLNVEHTHLFYGRASEQS